MSVVFQPNTLLLGFAQVSNDLEYASGGHHLAPRQAAKNSLIGSGI